MSNESSHARIAFLCAVMISVLMLTLSCSNQAAHERVREADRKELEAKRLAEENKVRNRESMAASAAEFSRLPTQTQLASQPYLKGKLVILEQISLLGLNPKDDAKKEAAPPWQVYDNYKTVHYSRVKEQLAEKPEDVGTIALLKFRVDSATYSALGNSDESVTGYQWSCDLTLVDRSIPAIIFKESFKGPRPTSASNTEGRKPTLEIEKFLSGLPQK